MFFISIEQPGKIENFNVNNRGKMETANDIKLPPIPNGMTMKIRYAQKRVMDYMTKSSEQTIKAEWPTLKCQSDELERKYEDMIKAYSKGGKSKYYSSLLAIKNILLDNLQTGGSDYFADKIAVFNKYIATEKEISKHIMDVKIVPTIKSEYNESINELILNNYHQNLEHKPKNQRVNILQNVILDVLMNTMKENPTMLNNVTTSEDIEYWLDPIRRVALINANFTPELFDKVLTNKLMTITAKEPQWSHDTVVNFMQECYISDPDSWIATKDLYDHYLKWMPKDQTGAPNHAVFSTVIPKELYTPKRKKTAGYLVSLRPKES